MTILIAIPKMPVRKDVVTGRQFSNTKSCGILDKFEGQENLGGERKPQISENANVQAIKQKFLEYLLAGNKYPCSAARDLAKNLTYSSEDIKFFSFALSHFQDEKNFSDNAGYFLSALIKNSKEEDFTIFTRHISVSIGFLVMGNAKNIIIEGNVGKQAGQDMDGGTLAINGNAGIWAGARMKKGTITINGNVDSSAGFEMESGTLAIKGNGGVQLGDSLQGGTITVLRGVERQAGVSMAGGAITIYGTAGDYLGNHMSGGTITVHGNALCFVGHGMKGGTIRVNGKISGLGSEINGGNIYQYNRLIVENGKQVSEINIE